MSAASLSLDVAQAIALQHVRHGLWRLGSVHEIRVGVTLRGRQPLEITLSPRITRRRDLRGVA